MDIQYLKNKIEVLTLENAFTKVLSRECRHADLEGLRKIIRDNPSICVLKISRLPFSNISEETFYSCNSKNPEDIEFIKMAREQLLSI